MAIVVTQKYNGEPFEKMFRRFRNKVKSENLMEDIKRSEYYEKPSARKRRKALAASRK